MGNRQRFGLCSPGVRLRAERSEVLKRQNTHSLFQRILGNPNRRWRFNQSPLFLEFLQGRYPLECTPWGNPTYNVFGWQKPCYLLDEGYANSFQELLDTTDWKNYGQKSKNPACTNCMVHSGHEPTAVNETFSSLRGLLTTARLVLFGPPKSRVGSLEPAGQTNDFIPQPPKSDTPLVPLQLQFDSEATLVGPTRS